MSLCAEQSVSVISVHVSVCINSSAPIRLPPAKGVEPDNSDPRDTLIPVIVVGFGGGNDCFRSYCSSPLTPPSCLPPSLPYLSSLHLPPLLPPLPPFPLPPKKKSPYHRISSVVFTPLSRYFSLSSYRLTCTSLSSFSPSCSSGFLPSHSQLMSHWFIVVPRCILSS